MSSSYARTDSGSGSPSAVGWAAVERSVRDVDEQMVNDYKEDIDSLLTFAGLFSAALTALLALSFNLLQEDTAGETLRVLRQIANQTVGYTIQNGLINTTAFMPTQSPAPAPAPPTFAVRTNALWFASLIFSLSTASLGILVKQWLREYMACTMTTSAQGRLRLRHFRHPGLATWKVLEIAASLPFLIQVSLALFFVGLCDFTYHANHAIGITAITLVAMWGGFFLFTIILPIFSGHCLYKTTFLERLLAAIRTKLYTALFNLLQSLLRPKSTPAQPKNVDGGWGLTSDVPQPTESEGRGLDSDKEDLEVGTFAATKSEQGDPVSDIDASTLVGRTCLWLQRRTPQCPAAARPYSELDAITFDEKDLDILASADGLHSNDELLGTAILEALRQSQPDLEQIIKFLLACLHTRLQRKEGIPPQPSLIDCNTLTRRARTAIIDVLSTTCTDGICDILSETDLQNPDAASARWGFCLILSPSQYPLPPSGFNFLGLCLLVDFARQPIVEYAISLGTPNPADTLAIVLGSVHHVCKAKGVALESALVYMSDILNVYFTRYGLPLSSKPYNVDLLDHDQPELWHSVLNSKSLFDTVLFLSDGLRSELGIQATRRETTLAADEWDEVYTDTLSLLVRLSSIARGTPKAFTDLLHDIVASQSWDGLYAILSPLIYQSRLSLDKILTPKIMLTLAIVMNSLEAAEGLPGIVADIIALDDMDDELHLGLAHFIRLCYILISIICEQRKLDGSLSFIDNWSMVLETPMERMFSLYHAGSETSYDDRLLVGRCLNHIHFIDTYEAYEVNGNNATQYEEWHLTFDPSQSLFSDDFIRLLNEISPDDEPYTWRYRRLVNMTPRADATALGDDGAEIPAQHVEFEDDLAMAEEAEADDGDLYLEYMDPASADSQTQEEESPTSVHSAIVVHLPRMLHGARKDYGGNAAHGTEQSQSAPFGVYYCEDGYTNTEGSELEPHSLCLDHVDRLFSPDVLERPIPH